MAIAWLLRRAPSTVANLAHLVEQSRRRHGTTTSDTPPQPRYELLLNGTHITLVALDNLHQLPVPSRSRLDEIFDTGFESDMDSLSSSSSSSSSSSCSNSSTSEAPPKPPDADSGLGSSDDSEPPPRPPPNRTQSYLLAECSCYTDTRYPDLLILVVQQDAMALVFQFEHMATLHAFHTNFATLKTLRTVTGDNNAIHSPFSNSTSALSLSSSTSLTPPSSPLSTAHQYDLLHHTDGDGVMHIEVARRRRSTKGRAPPPPDVMRGPFVRVNVPDADSPQLLAKSVGVPVAGGRDAAMLHMRAWSGSMLRLRSRSETRPPTSPALLHHNNNHNAAFSTSSSSSLSPSCLSSAHRYFDYVTIKRQQHTERIFDVGGSIGAGSSSQSTVGGGLQRWAAVSNCAIGHAHHTSAKRNLKSVIKNGSSSSNAANANAPKDGKKVTFSAYTTVQVL